ALKPATYISGFVVDQNDVPVPNADLKLANFQLSVPQPNVKSEFDGSFRFSRVHPGRYYVVTCQASGHTPVEINHLEAKLGKPIDDLMVRLAGGEGGTIIGRVINQDAQPVANTVLVLFANEGIIYSHTDEEGTFVFRDVVPGDCYIRLTLYNKTKRFSIKASEVIDSIEFVVDQDILSGYVSGVVLTAEGDPIGRGDLFAHESGVDRMARSSGVTTPDANGNFRLSNLKPGVNVDILYRGPSGPPRPTSATNIPVPAEGVTVMRVDSEGEHSKATLSGRVVDAETGQSIQQFSVGTSARDTRVPYGPYGFSQFFDGEGRFEIEYSRQHTCVWVKAAGYARKVEKIRGKEHVDVFLGKGGTIEGDVVNMAGQPVEGAQVYLSSAVNNYVLSDAEGAFRFENIGKFWATSLRASHPEYARFQSKSFATDENTAIKDFIARLGRGGTIAGTVLDESGNPLKGVEVQVMVRNYEAYCQRSTDEQGNYIVESVPPRDYRVSVPSLSSGWRQANVKEGEVAYVNFGGQIAGATVFGAVYASDKPLIGVSVVMNDIENNLYGHDFYATSPTDGNGHYSLPGIPSGRHYLMVYEGHKLLSSTLMDVPGPGQIEKNITLEAHAKISGVVLDDDGSPVRRVNVRLLDMYGPYARTRSDGSFELKDIPPGTYVIFAESGKLGEIRQEITLEAGESVEGLTLTFAGTSALTLVPVDAATGQELRVPNTYFSATFYLLDEDGRLHERRLSGPRTDLVKITGFQTGNYLVGGTFRNEVGEWYFAPVATPVSVTSDAASVTIRMARSITAEIELVDSNGEPVRDFQVVAYSSEGSRLPIMGITGNRISLRAGNGDVRIVVTKEGATIHDGVVTIRSEGGKDTFRTQVTVL
ncbi:carboxypeptidase regulatory-like domain-containing protein, partial [Candidatus Hydrogenedentota bacterium]